MHRSLIEHTLLATAAGDRFTLTGEEARHAIRVKRLRVGEVIELLDGRGGVAAATVEAIDEGGKKRDGSVSVVIQLARHVAPDSPRIECWSAVPKGGRLDDMIDQLAQVGAAAWRPLHTARTVVAPADVKVDRLTRIVREAGKQCGRAWTMEIGPAAALADALTPSHNTRIFLAHAGDHPPTAHSPAANIRLLIGPEGGWTDEELAEARAAGATLTAFGPHVMRLETAAVVACALARHATQRPPESWRQRPQDGPCPSSRSVLDSI